MGTVKRSELGVMLNNLNWGYQIVYRTTVIAAIHDTQGGPRRSEACTLEAEAQYERICALWQRLFSAPPSPSTFMVWVLASIIKRSTHRNRLYPSVFLSLERRGLIRRISQGSGYEHWEPVWDEIPLATGVKE